MTASRLRSTIRPNLQRGLLALLAVTLVACGPDDPLQSVRKLQAESDFEASIEPLRELLAERPDDPELQFRYGRALRELGELSMAQWALMRALEHPDWQRRAAFELGALNLQSGNWKQAIEAMDRVLKDDPENISALEFRANVRLRTRNQYAEALEDAELIAELDPENENVLAIRTVALMGLENREDASAALAELEEFFRESPSEALAARYCTANAMFAAVEKRHDDAEKLFLGCFENFPGSEVTFSGLVDFYETSGQRKKIIPFLKNLIIERPDEAVYRSELVSRLEEAGKFDDAEVLLLALTDRGSESERFLAWFKLGRHYMARGDYAAAAEASSKVLAMVPEPTSFMLGYHAEALILSDRLDDALEVAKRMSLATHRELVQGRVAFARGDCESARGHFNAALRLWPENAVVRYYSARCAEIRGDFVRAIEEYRYSLRSDPHATDARLRLVRLLAGQNDGASVMHIMRHGSELDSASMDPELVVIGIESLARSGPLAGVRNTLDSIREHVDAAQWAEVLAGATRGMAHRWGPGRAILFLTGRPDLDLDQVENLPLVDLLAQLENAAGKPDKGILRTGRSLEKAGAEAIRIEIHAAALARNGAPADEVAALYQRALALDPSRPRSAAALASFYASTGRPEVALAKIDSVLALDGMEQDRILLRERARWLGEIGHDAQATALLLDLLHEDPTDTGAARLLATFYDRPGGDPQRARRFAEQATRFSTSDDSSSWSDSHSP